MLNICHSRAKLQRLTLYKDKPLRHWTLQAYHNVVSEPSACVSVKEVFVDQLQMIIGCVYPPYYLLGLCVYRRLHL